MDNLDDGNLVVFTINGKVYKVTDKVGIETSLNTYIRDYARLKATKFMCVEGGCGCCVVSARIVNPVTKKASTFAVNSCLVLVYACHGWAVTTNEGIGNGRIGYSRVQATLAKFNGSQCGYCSSGMVMNMYSLLQSNKKSLTMKEVEDSFGGNTCRCTGYRSILNAFRSMATDAPKELRDRCGDIEDMVKVVTKNGCIRNCSKKYGCGGVTCFYNDDDDDDDDDFENDFVELALAPQSIQIRGSEKQWFSVQSRMEIFEVLDMIGASSYILLCGGTAKGVYNMDKTPNCYIDITRVQALKQTSIGACLKLGANVTLKDTMTFLRTAASKQPNKFAYCSVLADHIELVATVPVRNIGSLAGNISIKHKHRDFASDIFLILETVGAMVDIEDGEGLIQNVSLLQYLDTNMDKKLLTTFCLPVLDTSKYYIRTFKIMKRAQNAVAYVNAGFLFKWNKSNGFKVIDKPTIVFGGINPNFIHATKTEAFLLNKNLLDQSTLQGAFKILSDELKPNFDPLNASAEYRKGLALGLFYKFVLGINPEAVAPPYRSGGSNLVRPLSTGSVTYPTDKKLWPVTEPLPKLDILLQCSGEAEYVNDIPEIAGQLYCAFVLTTIGNAKLKSIDASSVLKMPGVHAFYSAKDIPGKNDFQPIDLNTVEKEPIFCDGDVLYAGQPVGVVVAETWQLANYAAGLVKVEYTDAKRPLLTVQEVLEAGDKSNILLLAEVTPTAKKDNVKYVVKGTFKVAKQYHFTIEPQTSFCVPIEDGMNVYSATQWPQNVQSAVSVALGLPDNSVNVCVRRVGGAYGAKFSRASLPAAACAVAAYLQGRPMRLVMSIESMMEALGKRYPLSTDYEVAVDDNGAIQYMNLLLYEDIGTTTNDLNVPAIPGFIQSIYDSSTWGMKGYGVKTNTPSNAYCRAPGSTEAIATIETIMEHIARTVKKDVNEVRMSNLDPTNTIAPQMINDLRKSSDFDARKIAVDKFNLENRWKKRGITLMPSCFHMTFYGTYNSAISIYEFDATVAISHGGIEMGQGINTKVAQVAAYTLGIDIGLIKVKPSNVFVSPNSIWSGGSQTSESVCRATIKSCNVILERLAPVRAKLKDPTWFDLIRAAFADNVDLHSNIMWKAQESEPYIINGVTVIEIEVDVLTGEYLIDRVDILQDAGQSLNPEIDLGQVEGAFVMGLGYYLTEELVYDAKSGALLTDRTWTYKPPGAKDIPIDFRVELRKNSKNPVGVFGSKAIGEPPLNLSACFLFVFRSVFESVRKDAGLKDDWFNVDPPLTPEMVFLYCANSTKQYLL